MPELSHLTFNRFGRSYHLKIEAADDLDGILDLDEAHWVATGAPVDTIHCDGTFLDLVDVDGNGRIMCYELIEAIRWLTEVLKDRTGVTEKSTTLKLDRLNTDCPDGESIHTAARKILTQSRAASDEVTLEQVRSVKLEVEKTSVSEAGVVLAEAADDEEIRTFITDVLATVGGAPHPSGSDGVNREKLDRFLAEARAWLDWHARADLPEGESTTDIMPLGDATHAAHNLFVALRGKLDQFFALSRAVALDPSLADRLGPTDAELDAMDLSETTVIEELLKDAPVAKPTAERTLAFNADINPHLSLIHILTLPTN